MSQELLTPLTSIKGSAARRVGLPVGTDKARQFFRSSEWAGLTGLRGQIWRLLEVARIEAGTLFLTPRPGTWLHGGPGPGLVSEGGRHPWSGGCPSELTPGMADRQRVLQVLDHLLANAADYSAEGSVITVHARREDPHVAVCVTDQGRGLPFQPLPLLFRRPSRRQAGDDRSGTGRDALGLAVCRGIVEAHGGRIWAESEGPAWGRSLFTCRWPRRPRCAALPPARGRPAAGRGACWWWTTTPRCCGTSAIP